VIAPESGVRRVGPSSRLPEGIASRLRVPAIAAPMLRVSGPDLVIAACRAGVVGAFPTLNTRSASELDAWLTRIESDLSESAAPVCPNLIMRSRRLREDLEVLVQHRVELVITSVGSPAPVIGPLHDVGVLVLADVASLEHAHKAVDAGADGLVLLAAGAGGQTGWLNPFAFVRAVRDFYSGPVVLAGGMSDGVALAAARLLGCDLGYIGTRFIATPESMADDDYRNMLVGSTMDDVLLTRAFNGLWGSFLRPSVVRAGLDPDQLDEMVTPEAAAARFGSRASAGVRRWSDIRSAGHSVTGVRAVESVAVIVERTRREYESAMACIPPDHPTPPDQPAPDRRLLAPRTPAPRPGSVESWAAKEPDRAVLFEGDRSMTWGQLNDAADRLAEGLARHGVHAGDIVVVRTQIRLEWVVIDAALAKLGCLLLGLNWRLTPDEVRYVLANSRARAVICDDPDPAALAGAFDATVLAAALSLDAHADGFHHYADLVAGPLVRRVSAAEARMVVYTSGTTGLPKGVVKAPRPGMAREAAEYLADVTAGASCQHGDTYLATMPFSHGAGPSNVRGALRAGAQVVFLRRFDAQAALALMVRHGVTSWVSVPTMLKRIAALPQDVLDAHRPTALRHVGTGAAPVAASLKHWVAGYFGDVLHEGYGATEVGMITHATPGMRVDRPSSSGLPHRHVTIDIRDGEGHPLSAGQAGEIWVRTPLVISSYLNGAPLGPDVLDARGFFRTGDVGHLDAAGYLFITDRAKDMIVSGGVNLYPAEIEAALLTHPKVQDAAVIGIPDEEFGEQVKAFVELKPGQRAEPAEIAEGVADQLASYKRPKSIEIVEELPRNLMGKLLKKDLRAPYWEGRERQV
jgi:long-chain acyl-CoA synthetase